MSQSDLLLCRKIAQVTGWKKLAAVRKARIAQLVRRMPLRTRPR